MILDLDQKDIERIAEAVAARLERPEQTPWLKRSEAAEYLRCTVKHLDGLVRLGEIPVYRPSGPTGRPLFHREDLDQFVLTNRREF